MSVNRFNIFPLIKSPLDFVCTYIVHCVVRILSGKQCWSPTIHSPPAPPCHTLPFLSEHFLDFAAVVPISTMFGMQARSDKRLESVAILLLFRWQEKQGDWHCITVTSKASIFYYSTFYPSSPSTECEDRHRCIIKCKCKIDSVAWSWHGGHTTSHIWEREKMGEYRIASSNRIPFFFFRTSEIES